MEGLLGQREATRTSAAMAARVALDAKRAFSSRADELTIDAFVKQAVDELTVDRIRVTTFVPVLALRRVRELIDTRTVGTMDISAGA